MKHDTLMNALKVFPKSCRIKGENAGVHLLLEIPGKHEEDWYVEEAKKRGIRVQGLNSACFEENREDLPATLILGYAVLKEQEMKRAVEILYELYCM